MQILFSTEIDLRLLEGAHVITVASRAMLARRIGPSVAPVVAAI